MSETTPGSALVTIAQADESEAELPEVSIYGDLAGMVTTIPSCMLSLVVRIGRLDDDSRVLVPMTEIQFSLADIEDDGSEEDAEEGFAAVVPLENAAFIVSDLAADLELVCEELAAFSSSALGPEPNRMARCVQYLQDARARIDGCLVHLDTVPGATAGG